MKHPIALPLALLLLLPASSFAQRGGGRPTPPPQPTSPPITVAPPIAPPAGPAAISVPNPIGSMQPGPRDLYQRPDGGDRFQRLQLFPFFPGGGYGYGGGYYPAYPPGYVEMPPPFTPRPPAVRGALRIETIPGSAQVFVDGAYVGLADDFGLQGRGYELPLGTHRVELRAPGYETAAFDVNTNANEVTRYRGDLRRVAAASAAAPQAAAAPKPLYIIPNCYAGNRPPKRLPKGCTTAGMQVIK